MNTPFYDAAKSYKENYDQGPFGVFVESPSALPKPASSQFLGFTVDLPFGIPAGPLLTGRFVAAAWRWGFSLATYKTVRGNTYPCHPFPNVIKVKAQDRDIHPGDTVEGDLDVSRVDVEHEGITNSFGVPSKPIEYWQEDVKETVKQEKDGNLLILSFMGTKQEAMTLPQYVEDFARTCRAAKDTGARVLEVNFSCPNVGKEGLICNDVETSRTILEALKEAKGNVPLLVKIGYFPKDKQGDLEALLEAIRANAQGIVAINTITAKVVDGHGEQLLPGSPVRLVSGICGRSIRWAGGEMVSRIMSVKKFKGWRDLAVVGVGGVTTPDDYFRYMNLGVDAVQSATGAMWKPRLAWDIRNALVKGMV